MGKDCSEALQGEQGGGSGAKWEFVVVLAVEGIETAQDAWLLRLHLSGVAGVRGVEVLYRRGVVRVAYDPAQITPEALPMVVAQCPERYGAQIVLTSRPAPATERTTARARDPQAYGGRATSMDLRMAEDIARQARIWRAILSRISHNSDPMMS